MIVFEVSGVIAGHHVIRHGNVTIAGQTAPGAGVTLAGRLYGAYDASVGNIIVRHVRVRPRYDGSSGEQFDAIQLSRNRLLILDHVSVAWGVDETIDLYEADDVTVQYCTIEESAVGDHPEGEHNYGLIHGPDGHRISVHHNLFAHHKNRSPAIANGPADVRNNVIYNGRHGFVHHNPASGAFNIVGNTYIRGPNDRLFPFWFDDESGGNETLAYHLADNFVDDPGVLVATVGNPWESPPSHPSFVDLALPATFYRPTPAVFGEPTYRPVTTQSADEARARVLREAGAFPRDVVTTRTVEEVVTRGGSWGTQMPADLMAGLTAGTAPDDRDGDGMADDWELERGLDPADGTDHDTVQASGYTAIEVYVNELADALVAQSADVPSRQPETAALGHGAGSPHRGVSPHSSLQSAPRAQRARAGGR